MFIGPCFMGGTGDNVYVHSEVQNHHISAVTLKKEPNIYRYKMK